MITIRYEAGIEVPVGCFWSVPFLVHVLHHYFSVKKDYSSHVEVCWSVELEVGSCQPKWEGYPEVIPNISAVTATDNLVTDCNHIINELFTVTLTRLSFDRLL